MQDAPQVEVSPLVGGYVHINPQEDPFHYIARGSISALGFPHIDFGPVFTKLVVGDTQNPHPRTGLHHLSFRLGENSDLEKGVGNMTAAMQDRLIAEGPALVASLHEFAARYSNYAPTCEDLIALIVEVSELAIEGRPVRPANDAKGAFAPPRTGTLETSTQPRLFAPLLDPKPFAPPRSTPADDR